jgi:dephospho-CoA kinase
VLRVGLTGGYATGKSFVGAELERLGCHLIYADKLGHRVLEPDGDAYLPTIRLFGRRILDEAGRIDRKKLGALVFGAPEPLKELSAIVHPAVFRLEEQRMNEIETHDRDAIAVVEAAILIETGRYKVFDRLILTTCDEDLQIARAIRRDGLSADQVRARFREQMPFSQKRQFADYVVDTGVSPADTLRQVRKIYADLRVLAGSGS